MAQQHDAPHSQLVRLGIADLERRLGADRSTIWRWYRAGKFPAPHYLGERRVWLEAEITAWELQAVARQAVSRRGASNLRGGAPATSAPTTSTPAA